MNLSLIMMCTAAETRISIEGIKSWVLGKYIIEVEPDGAEVQMLIDAAIGLAEWRVGMTGQQVIADADANMYEAKRSSREPS